MTDLHARRREIALAEQAVERHRHDFQRRTAETRVRVASVRERMSAWKVPLIIGGGALLGLLLGRRSGSSSRPARDRHDAYPRTEHDPRSPDDAHEPVVAQTAKAAGKMAGLMAGLSLASRALPVLMPLLSAYAERRGRLDGAVGAARAHGRTDWWALARGIAPLIRR